MDQLDMCTSNLSHFILSFVKLNPEILGLKEANTRKVGLVVANKRRHRVIFQNANAPSISVLIAF
jgi:hypothetical protein